MDYTKKIMYQSNSWYNDGLRKAQVRDMSGAIVSLQQSLQYNRENIAARNLLGLVYYGIGEVSEALVEWIISKNLCPRDNIADYYIKKVQNSANELESLNQAIKKFNQCLVYCQQNGEDLAIIQLKQVIASHPTFLKAYQLLALIYIQMNQNTKARQILIEAKKLDTTNELTLTYLREVTKQRGRHGKDAERSFRKPKSAAVEYSLGNETIIQPKRSKIRDMAQQLAFANILIGMVLGAALIWFLVAPAVNQNRSEKLNNQMRAYSEQINTLEAQVSAQEHWISIEQPETRHRKQLIRQRQHLTVMRNCFRFQVRVIPENIVIQIWQTRCLRLQEILLETVEKRCMIHFLILFSQQHAGEDMQPV